MQHIKVLRNFLPYATSASRWYCLTTNFNKSLYLRKSTPIYSQLLPSIVPNRGFKDKDVLTKRCKDCYFTKMDGRWYVLCNTHPRHKQRQKIDEKSRWIITHETHGKKKF